MSKALKIFSMTLFFFLLSCQSEMIKARILSEMNDDFASKVYVAKEDIIPSFVPKDENNMQPVLKKGDNVALYLESGAQDWLRIKAYDPSKSRETAKGKVVIYIFKVDHPKEKDFQTLLQAEIEKKFTLKK